MSIDLLYRYLIEIEIERGIDKEIDTPIDKQILKVS